MSVEKESLEEVIASDLVFCSLPCPPPLLQVLHLQHHISKPANLIRVQTFFYQVSYCKWYERKKEILVKNILYNKQNSKTKNSKDIVDGNLINKHLPATCFLSHSWSGTKMSLNYDLYQFSSMSAIPLHHIYIALQEEMGDSSPWHPQRDYKHIAHPAFFHSVVFWVFQPVCFHGTNYPTETKQ